MVLLSDFVFSKLVAVVTHAVMDADPNSDAMVATLNHLTDDLVVIDVPRMKDLKPDVYFDSVFGALATRVRWSPDERDFQDCWAVTAVTPGLPAFAVIGPWDGEWYRIPPLEFPWFVAATAGGIRKAIEKGEPMVVKTIQDPALYEQVQSGVVPPIDEDGRV